MAKSSATVQDRSGRGHGAIVDVVHRRQAHRLGKIAFIVTWTVLTPTVTVVAAAITDLTWAVLVGTAAGLAAACVAGLVTLMWPVLRLIWWWTGEILALGLLLATYLGLTHLMAWPAAVAVMAATAGGLLAIPPTRRFLAAWVWCAISRHRLRTCFATFVRVNRRGSIPLILPAWPTPAGERVWVMLRPGLALDDLTTDGGLARLAVGCWAHQVQLTRAFGRFAALIRVDITRRNPLAGTVTSPLTALLPHHNHTNGTQPGDERVLDGLGLDLPDIPDPTTTTTGTAAAARARVPRSRTTETPPAEPAVIGRGGEDISDWL